MTDEDIARRFHDAYERLAPRFGWETQQRSRVEWDDLPEENRALMVAVVAEVVGPIVAERDAWKVEAVHHAADVARLRDASRHAR